MAGRQEITLTGGRPWGFSLMGGADHHSILRVGRVTPGSKSSLGGLKDGDVFISINGQVCEGLKHVEAQQLVKNAGNELVLVIERGDTVKSMPASFVKVAPPPAATTPKPLPPPKKAVARPPPPVSQPKPPPRAQEEKKEAGGSSWYKQLMKTLKDQDEKSEVYIPPAASMTQEASPKPNPPQTRQASIRKPPQVVQARVEHPPPKHGQANVIKPTPPPVYSVQQPPIPQEPPTVVKPTPPPVTVVKPTPPPVTVVKPTPPPVYSVQRPLIPQEPPTVVKPTPPPQSVEQPPPVQEPPRKTPTPPPPVEVEQPPTVQEATVITSNAPPSSDDNALVADTVYWKESKEVSPVVQEVEAEYKEALEKQKEEETKINELERQIEEDLLNLQETVQQAGATQTQPAEDETPAPAAIVHEPVTSVAEVKDEVSPNLQPIETEPPRATAVIVNPVVEEDKMQHFHPLIQEEMSKEATKEVSPGRLEGDFSALEELTAPGRHLPADVAIQTHREPEPEPEPEPAPVVVKKKHIPPPAEKARALFDFKPNSERELAFSAGDIITLTRTVDDNWLEGTVDGRSGIVPINYVELCTDEPTVPPPSEFAENPPCVKALYRFVPEGERELAFEEDDVISLTRIIDDNWFEGVLNGKRGIVPSSFVEVLVPLPGMVVQPPEEQKPSDLPPQEQAEVFEVKEPLQSENSVQETGERGGDEEGRTLTVEELQEALAGLTAEKHAVVFEYTPSTTDEIEILEGDTILVYEKCEDGWYLGVNERTQQFGTFPGNYVKAIL